MTLNPHDLINTPGYGNAEKALRKAGLWRELMTDSERIDWLAENVSKMTRSENDQSWYFNIDCDDYDPEWFRHDIDEKAMEATT